MDPAIIDIFEFYLLAILLGALMGLEREREKTRLAGLRTFILVTLFGSICGQISQIGPVDWIVPSGMVAIMVHSAILHFLRMKQEFPAGLTTATALLVAYGIGVLVSFEQLVAAVSLSLATTVILYFKPQMHEFSHRLSKQDLYAIFQFVLVAFIILPILPDQGYGPFKALNPSNIWFMVVMISGINLIGYVILKLVGHRWGGLFLGALGGLVSSTATTLSFGRHAKKTPEFSLTGTVIVSLASAVMLIRMAFLIGIIHIDLLAELAVPMTGMFICGLVPTYFVWRKSSSQEVPPPTTRNPAELKQALVFGLLYAIILLAVSFGKDFFGNKGVYLVSLASGFFDVDAITLSNARMAETGVLAVPQAGISILIAMVANLCFKLVLIGLIGTSQMFRWVLFCFICLALPALLVFVKYF